MQPAAFSVLAFDLGGTRIKAGIVRDGRVGEMQTLPTRADFAASWRDLVQLGHALRVTQAGVQAVGLCVPGLVGDDGRVIALPGKLPGIVGVDLLERLHEAFSLPAIVRNDAIAFGLGEALAGAGRDHRRVVVVTIGTGVGVSVYEDGAPLGRGPFGGGLLGGQIPICDALDAVDTNGRAGTIEARCAAHRLLALGQQAGGHWREIADLYAAQRAGDAVAAAAIDSYRRELGRALVALAHAHAPDCIVVGGGPMAPGNPVFPGLAALVRSQVWPGYRIDILAAELGDAAALVGLAELALRLRAE